MSRFFSEDANCGRARTWASLELDGELSQLERIFLAAHLRRCEACARFVTDVRGLSAAVRSTPLEARERLFVFPARGSTPRRGRLVAWRVGVATAAVSVAVGVGILGGSLGGEQQRQAPQPAATVALLQRPSAGRELKDIRRKERIVPRERVNPPGRLGGNV